LKPGQKIQNVASSLEADTNAESEEEKALKKELQTPCYLNIAACRSKLVCVCLRARVRACVLACVHTRKHVFCHAHTCTHMHARNRRNRARGWSGESQGCNAQDVFRVQGSGFRSEEWGVRGFGVEEA
jgi:hypothetical protein